MPSDFEQLQFGQHSREQEVRYARPNSFARRLRKMWRERSAEGVYTEGLPSRAAFYEYPPELLHNLRLKYPGRYSREDIAEAIQGQRKYIARHEGLFVLPGNQYKECINFLNALEHTVMKMIDAHKNFDIDGFDVFYNIEGGTTEHSRGMHRDTRKGSMYRSFAVINTILGPSTIYEAKDGRVIVLPDASMAGHVADGIVHATPQYNKRARLAIVIGFIPRHTTPKKK